MADRFALNINITGVNDQYTVDFDYLDNDDNDINVTADGDSLEETLGAAYEEVLNQITQAAKDDHEDMTDAEYIEYLENRIIELKNELAGKQEKPEPKQQKKPEPKSEQKPAKKYNNTINYTNAYRKLFNDFDSFERLFDFR